MAYRPPFRPRRLPPPLLLDARACTAHVVPIVTRDRPLISTVTAREVPTMAAAGNSEVGKSEKKRNRKISINPDTNTSSD